MKIHELEALKKSVVGDTPEGNLWTLVAMTYLRGIVDGMSGVSMEEALEVINDMLSGGKK